MREPQRALSPDHDPNLAGVTQPELCEIAHTPALGKTSTARLTVRTPR
jgi:hypothetical protein